MNETVLLYLLKQDQVLLLYRNKKKDDLNEGKYIGIGGHIELNETREEALIRETKEETNLDLNSFIYLGEILFTNTNNLESYQEKMYVYQSSDFSGELKECDEGRLEWVDIKDIFSLPMWEGDKAFLPFVFSGQREQSKNKPFSLELIYQNKEFKKCIKKN